MAVCVCLCFCTSLSLSFMYGDASRCGSSCAICCALFGALCCYSACVEFTWIRRAPAKDLFIHMQWTYWNVLFRLVIISGKGQSNESWIRKYIFFGVSSCGTGRTDWVLQPHTNKDTMPEFTTLIRLQNQFAKMVHTIRSRIYTNTGSYSFASVWMHHPDVHVQCGACVEPWKSGFICIYFLWVFFVFFFFCSKIQNT